MGQIPRYYLECDLSSSILRPANASAQKCGLAALRSFWFVLPLLMLAIVIVSVIVVVVVIVNVVVIVTVNPRTC